MISVSQLSLGNVDEYSQPDASKLNTSQPQYADLASMHHGNCGVKHLNTIAPLIIIPR